MSFENPSQLIRSWALQGSFSSGAVVQDKLVPKRFARIRTPFVNTYRTEAISSQLDWGTQAFSFYLPESLRVISSMFLEIPLPALAGGKLYKTIPGFYAVKRIRFLSAGQESYSCEVGQYLRDYVESLTSEKADRFCKTYLGYVSDAGSNVARKLHIPILLPNSAYMSRSGGTRGHGCWPCYTGSNRLEIQITMAADGEVVKQADTVPASISGTCNMLIHQVDMATDDILRYSDVRGAYSVITRRFTELTQGWSAATANVRERLTQNQPIGTVTELFCLAVPTGTDEALREIHANVQATHFSIISDSVTQKSLDSAEKVQMELWNNGFHSNSFCDAPSRLCFAAHASESDGMYTGGFNMQLSSQISVECEFAEDVDYRIFAVQLQRVTVNSIGLVQASLD